MKTPVFPCQLMMRVYRDVIPQVHQELAVWKQKAASIPDEELRTQALASIREKTFHCEGGGILSLLAGPNQLRLIRFITAYQTISDYLDNLCDRSDSMDPEDFRSLHQAMLDVFDPAGGMGDYYAFRKHEGDRGYLKDLVTVCREELVGLTNYAVIEPEVKELAKRYTELQVHKHVTPEERVPRLTDWFLRQSGDLTDKVEWYEYAASTGSTLGIFTLVAYASSDDHLTEEDARTLYNGYFPWLQGLHILMDYFIDQEEDRVEGDLNFCTYYEDDQAMLDGIGRFYRMAKDAIRELPDRRFHRMITSGLIAIYLSDPKVRHHPLLRKQQLKLIQFGGPQAIFFYLNGRYIHKK